MNEKQLNGKGLPPVGCFVDINQWSKLSVSDVYPLNEWLDGDSLEVIAHKIVSGKIVSVVWNSRHESASTIRTSLLIPVRTPEQIAAYDRKAVINHMANIANSVGPGFSFGALYDAGYRLTKEASK